MAIEENVSNHSAISLVEINNAISLINPLIIKIITAIIILLLGFIIGKIIERIVYKILDLIEFDKLIKRFIRTKDPNKIISRIVSYIINILALVMALNHLEITTTLITTIVIILLIVLILFILFGTNDLFANFFAGIVVRLRKNIQVGDNIRIRDKEKKIEGKVLGIGYISMQLSTDKEDIIYIPNMLLFKSVITKLRITSENKPAEKTTKDTKTKKISNIKRNKKNKK